MNIRHLPEHKGSNMPIFECWSGSTYEPWRKAYDARQGNFIAFVLNLTRQRAPLLHDANPISSPGPFPTLMRL
jgi:hypothetical protein